ncbi:MAG: DUF1338 domain-containing protein [Marinilabiliales bacterium]|nr:MAG: DUF1338 domain-containing protein [Marinilabiliales bacterium]
MTLEELFNKLWIDYTAQNPAAKKVYELFTTEGEEVVNDHIAFRTFDDPKINIDVLSKTFLEKGYEEKGQYEFKEKHLFAKHFEHKTDKNAPRVFISQLKTSDFSEFLQKILKSVVHNISEEALVSEELIFSGNVWGTPDYDTYLRLREESEYAAWVYVYGFRANHFTVSVNGLKKFDNLEQVNQFLKDNNFLLNSSGGEIKGTKEQLLRQSSIMANHISVEFTNGVYSIPGCYYEFAQRYLDENGKLYSGFIAKSADKIFESTNYYKG